MSFINYSDDEVKIFHPICERALNSALKNLGLDSTYEVKHHYRYQGIIPDFVILNKNTGNILIVIEVKRTPSQVMSTRYRLQAQSYITNAASQTFEQKYFALTNLEKTYLFKYNPQNTSVINQVVNPSPINTGRFSDSPLIFESQLVADYTQMIQVAQTDSGTYQLSYDDIVRRLCEYTDDFENWHSAITVIGYELIRSIMQNYQPSVVNVWGNAISYQRNPVVLQKLVNTIDFQSLGDGNILNDARSPYWQAEILKKASTIGNKTYSGDEFASVVHELLVKGHEGEGIVPTDMELAAALAELVSSEFSNPNEKVYCDPASGSGNLLSAIIDRNQNINPSNIWANDRLEYLKDILSIRFGLKFPRIISPSNAPKITDKDIVTLSKKDFSGVDAIVMNPPYVSGVRDTVRKKMFFDKIKLLSGRKKPITDVGQMPLEGPFIELLLNLVKDGTVIGIVIPEQHLFGKGRESTAIRELLLTQFGLKKIFTYPRTGLFETVTKGTVVVLGNKGHSPSNVEIINSSLPIEQIDLRDLVQDTGTPFGVDRNYINVSDLSKKISSGWKSTMYPFYDTFFSNISKSISTLKRSKYFRGSADNSGEGKYLYVSKQGYWNSVKSLIPHSWLKEGIQNVQDYPDNGPLVHTSTTVKALCPPETAFVSGTPDNVKLLQILSIAKHYLSQQKSSGSQPRQQKSLQEIANILENVTKRLVPPGRLLIPRALRNDFKVFETTAETVVSTNFIVLELTSTEKEAFLSWLMSIFGQIQIEMLSKPQEGMRKVEVTEIGMVQYPLNFSSASKPFINSSGYQRSFSNYLSLNETDEYWMRELGISMSDYIGLVNLMSKLIDLRNP